MADPTGKRSQTSAEQWNTDPLFDSQGGPDNVSDGIVAATNGVVALWRKVRARFSRH